MATRIVIDTSVLISALVSDTGPAREVLRRGLRGIYRPLIGNALFTEYEDVAARPEILSRCPVSRQDIRDLLNALYATSEWVRIYYLWRPNLSDEADNHVLELAVAGQAQYIVTRNLRDFHNAELRFRELMFRTPEQLLEEERHGDIND